MLPVLATIAIAGTGWWILYPLQGVGDAPASGLASVLFAHAPIVCPIVVGLAVGIVIQILQQSAARQRELKAANSSLQQLNEQLRQEVQNAQQSEQRFRLLFSSNPSPMWIYDCDSFAINDVNEAALQQYGYTREEFLGLTALDLRPPEEQEQFISQFREYATGYGFRGAWTHQRKDASRLQVEIRAFRFGHNGSTRELVLAQDVTARVETEEALLRSQVALESLIDNAPFGICSTSPKGDRFTDFNAALAEMLGGYTAEEMLALKLSTELYSNPKDRDRMLELIRRNRRLNAFETTLLRKDGKPVRVRIYGVLSSQQPGESELIQAYVEDITEHGVLEQQVRQVQKLEAVGRLAGGVAHDFNNILVIIRLSTELMLSTVTPESPLSKPLLQVLNAADRAASLTRQLLAFGRQQVMQVRPVNLNTVVTDTLQLLRRTIGEDVDVATRFDEELASTRLDPDQLAQVIMNLAINSRDAMPQGGTLSIETRNVTLDANYARNHAPVQPGKYVMLAVTDSGTGIDNAILPRIFDPFFTTKEVGKGTGLGLSIVYGIVKQSGGYVWVYSEPGKGTTFKLYFPVTDAQPANSEQRADILPLACEKRILVVEDEPEIREHLCECLRQLGYEVLEAADGQEAVELFEKHPGKVDMVLTDLVMPRMGGQELWTRLTALDPEIGFLFTSGYTQDNALRREMLSPHNLFLTKPFSVADLSNALQRAFALQGVHSLEHSTTG